MFIAFSALSAAADTTRGKPNPAKYWKWSSAIPLLVSNQKRSFKKVPKTRRPKIDVLIADLILSSDMDGRLDEHVQLLAKPFRKEDFGMKIRQIIDGTH